MTVEVGLIMFSVDVCAFWQLKKLPLIEAGSAILIQKSHNSEEPQAPHKSAVSGSREDH